MWYGIQPPLRGTDISKVLKKLCPTLLADKKFGGGVDCATKNDTTTNKPVVPTEYTIAESWGSLRESEVPSWVAAIASEKMHGSMCGVEATDYSKPASEADKTAFGSIAKAMGARKRQRELLRKDWTARNTPNARTPKFGNDGIVPFSSCKVNGNKRYEKDSTKRYYAVDGNHDFGTCSEGQKDGSKNKEPCSWMAHMIEKARTKLGRDSNKPPAPTPAPAPAKPASFVQIHHSDEQAGEVETEDQAEIEAVEEAEDEVEEAVEDAEEADDEAEDEEEEADQ